MQIYFLRHGPAGSRMEWSGDDDARPLTDEGKARMTREAAVLQKLGVAPAVILTSPLARARQTAEIVAARLGSPDFVVCDERLSPGFGPRDLADILGDHRGVSSVMLVGHEPDFSLTIGEFVGGGRVALKKGGLARVDVGAAPATAGGGEFSAVGAHDVSPVGAADVSPAHAQLVWLLPPSVLAVAWK